MATKYTDHVRVAEQILSSGILAGCDPVILRNGRVVTKPAWTLQFVYDTVLNGRNKNRAMKVLVALLEATEPYVAAHTPDPQIQAVRQWHQSGRLSHVGAPLHISRGECIHGDIERLVELWLAEVYVTSAHGRAVRSRLRKLHGALLPLIEGNIV